MPYTKWVRTGESDSATVEPDGHRHHWAEYSPVHMTGHTPWQYHVTDFIAAVTHPVLYVLPQTELRTSIDLWMVKHLHTERLMNKIISWLPVVND